MWRNWQWRLRPPPVAEKGSRSAVAATQRIPSKFFCDGCADVAKVRAAYFRNLLPQSAEYGLAARRVSFDTLGLSLNYKTKYADVAELADAPDLGSGIFRCAGSIPVIRTKNPCSLEQGFFYSSR